MAGRKPKDEPLKRELRFYVTEAQYTALELEAERDHRDTLASMARVLMTEALAARLQRAGESPAQ